MPGRSLRQQNRLDRNRRDADIWSMRSAGVPIDEIAGRYEISPNSVRAALNRATDVYQLEAAETMIKLELERLDLLLRKAIEVLNRRHVAYSNGRLMTDPETKEAVTDSAPILAAINSVLKIMDRRSKYLALDAPTRSEQHINVHKTSTDDLPLRVLIEQAQSQANALTPDALNQALALTPQSTDQAEAIDAEWAELLPLDNTENKS